MATTTTMSQHLAPGFREIVGTNLGGRESVYSTLLNMKSTERNYEDILNASGLPMATEKPELQPIQRYDPLEGSTKRVNMTVYAIGCEFSEEVWEDDLYKGNGSAIRDAGSGLADSLAELVEIQAHRFFNSEAFLTSAVPAFLRPLPDNVSTISLFSKVGHNPIAGGEAAAQTNQPTTDVDLTITSYRAGLVQFRRWRNDRNMRIPGFTSPQTLLVAPEGEYDAQEIVNSASRPDQSNPNVANVTKGKTAVKVSPYCDDTDAWFLLGAKHFLDFYWRWRPRMDSFDDRSSRAAVMVSYLRFGMIAKHWLGTYASSGG